MQSDDGRSSPVQPEQVSRKGEHDPPQHLRRVPPDRPAGTYHIALKVLHSGLSQSTIQAEIDPIPARS